MMGYDKDGTSITGACDINTECMPLGENTIGSEWFKVLQLVRCVDN